LGRSLKKVILCKKLYRSPCKRIHNVEHPKHHNLLRAPENVNVQEIFESWMWSTLLNGQIDYNMISKQHQWRLLKNLKCGKFGKLTNTYLQNTSWCPQDKMWYMSSSSWRSKSFVTSKWNWVKSWIFWRWSSTIGKEE
jgi:hypothetical protein